ncbi:MAG TPA: ABC transporter ATP-binding protein [Solirubrobacterales bacterium]|nr:ABC transporter ATP-binding protein [Solirubrobacterales bacterium]
MSAVKSAAPVLEVDGLRVGFANEAGVTQAVDGVSLELGAGEVLAIVGESGSGKSVTALSIMGLAGAGARVEGSVRLEGQELLGAAEEELREVRGARVGMVFQDPSSSFNPVYKVGNQIDEAIRAHRALSAAETRELTLQTLGAVGVSDPERLAGNYPHQLSGGMGQRAMIAMALALEPTVLIADEPTTALDVTIQAQVLALLARLNRERDLATILITHDLGVVAEVADRVAVMRTGRVVEEGTLDQVFYEPRHPHTRELLEALARLGRPRAGTASPTGEEGR